MAPSATSQRRTHNILLLQKLLSLRDGASPFTLLLDTLEQSARPVIQEFIQRAKISRTKVIFVSFRTLRRPKDVDIFITGRRKELEALNHEIVSQFPLPQSAPSTTPKALVIFDTIHQLASTVPAHLPNFLSGLISPITSVLATYHTDIPIPPLSSTQTTPNLANPYAPSPLTSLMYLSTSILRVSNLAHIIERKKARDRSIQEPVFGMDEGKEGILIGAKGGGLEGLEGVVVEMEVRRKSGRGIRETFVLSIASTNGSTSHGGPSKGQVGGGKISLLDDHPLFAITADSSGVGGVADDGDGEDDVETTFSLGLTEKQRRDRESVVLPYFDAQKGDGSREGGRILYEMDRGDDFDEEEDEI